MNNAIYPIDAASPAPPLVPGSRRGKPGRPRTGDTGIVRKPGDGHENGHTVYPTQERQARRGNDDEKNRTEVQRTSAPVVPRLLDLHVSARYLGLSQWTVRTLEQQGILKRVRVPLPNHGELRKLLFDRTDLDRLVDSWKETP